MLYTYMYMYHVLYVVCALSNCDGTVVKWRGSGKCHNGKK